MKTYTIAKIGTDTYKPNFFETFKLKAKDIQDAKEQIAKYFDCSFKYEILDTQNTERLEQKEKSNVAIQKVYEISESTLEHLLYLTAFAKTDSEYNVHEILKEIKNKG